MAAIFAATGDRRVVLLERTKDGGRKILISGGGRCNVLPSRLDPSRFVTDSSPASLRNMLRSWPLAEQRRADAIGMAYRSDRLDARVLDAIGHHHEGLVQHCVVGVHLGRGAQDNGVVAHRVEGIDGAAVIGGVNANPPVAVIGVVVAMVYLRFRFLEKHERFTELHLHWDTPLFTG